MKSALLSLTILLLHLPAFSEPSTRPALIDNQPSTKLFEREISDAVTTMLFSTASQQFKGTIVLYGGLGAKSAAFGIGASMGHIANKSLKENIEPFAFQNPLYFHDDLPEAERLALVGKYRDLDAQLDWLARTLRLARAKAVNSSRMILGGRSTGGALLLEAYHQYLVSGKFSDIFAHVDDLLIMGTVDPRTFTEWHAREHAYLQTQKQIFDGFSFASEPAIYAPMRQLTENVFVPRNLKLARVTFVVGTNDELNSVHAQLEVAKTFARLHAGLPIHVIVSDTNHNPAASISYMKAGEQIKVRTMKRLSPILENIFNRHPADEPGFHLHINPEAEPCQLLLGEDAAAR